MTDSPGALLPVALHAVATANSLLLSGPPATVTEKSDRDLVSDVDVAIERAVRAQLADATPGIGFLGEEEGRTGGGGGEWLWTLDPIDGTSNYAHGIPLCAISLALLHHGRAVLAVIDAPYLSQRYHAVEGQGAYAGTRRLAASATADLRDAVVAIGDYATGDDAERRNQHRLAITSQLAPRAHRIRMLGTAALDLAWVADGRLDASITLGNRPWDTAAGVLIVREAGGSVADKDGTPHDLNSAATVAAPRPLLDQLIPLIQATDTEYKPMNPAPAPHAALGAIIARTAHLILDFDGPICDLFAATPAATITAQLRAALPAGSAPGIGGSPDPFEILTHAATASAELGDRADKAMTELELTAAATATPAAYIHDVIAACRDLGRSATVTSRHSADAVRAYLTASSLIGGIALIVARAGHAADQFHPDAPPIEQTLSALGAEPSTCALVTASAARIQAASHAGLHTIGYATAPGMPDALTTAGAHTTITSLADLVLVLRARPLPN
jgi:myo-inositol-1(or 4)-monophosphatase